MSGPIIRNSTLDFFLARAEQARVEGEAATLEHVRERFRRSEDAWNALAARAVRAEQLKVADAQRRAGQPLD